MKAILLLISLSTSLALTDFRKERAYYSERNATIFLEGSSDARCYGGFISSTVVLTSATCVGIWAKVENKNNFETFKFNPFDPQNLFVVYSKVRRTGVEELHIHDHFGLSFFSDEHFVFNVALMVVKEGNSNFFEMAPISTDLPKLPTCFYGRKISLHLDISASDNFRGDSCSDAICISNPECTQDVEYSQQHEGFRCANELVWVYVDYQKTGGTVVCGRQVYGVVTTLGPWVTYWTRVDDELTSPFIQKVLNKIT